MALHHEGPSCPSFCFSASDGDLQGPLRPRLHHRQLRRRQQPRAATVRSSHPLSVVAPRMIAPPSSAHGPGRSPGNTQAQTGFSTGSISNISDASSAGMLTQAPR